MPYATVAATLVNVKDSDVRAHLSVDELRVYVAAELGQQPKAIADALREVARLRAALLAVEVDADTESCPLCAREASIYEDGHRSIEHADSCVFTGMPRPKRAATALLDEDRDE